MDANEYKTYLLGLVFYNYLSDSYLAYLDRKVKKDYRYTIHVWGLVPSAYKGENENALPKFKFKKLMIDEFKNALMPEIAPLID